LPEQTEQDVWLSVADVAAELGMHPSTVRKWANEGALRGVRMGERQWRFRRSAVREFERRHEASGQKTGSAVSSGEGSANPAFTTEADLVDLDES
jgi:excisionase family DNA binding protein